jgi:phosphate acetyltransferase
MSSHERYDRLIAAAKEYAAVPTAVAHPSDESALSGAMDAAKLGLIRPILVGPKDRIAAAAKQLGLDLAGCELIDAPHSQAAATRAVELVREGRAEALMKGSLHTDELMAAVVRRDTGLRTARRISHCFVMDVPGYDYAIIISDAAVNIAPTLVDKIDIVQNAIDLGHALRFPGCGSLSFRRWKPCEPERSVHPGSSGPCARWPTAARSPEECLTAQLALDNAISADAAAIKKIVSPVAGRANVLIVPRPEAGNMLAKSLSFPAKADSAASCSVPRCRSS